MSSVLLIFCCLLGLGSAWNQPSTCYFNRSQSSSGIEAELTKIRESLEYLSELEHIREALETIANRLLGMYVKVTRVYCNPCMHVINYNNLFLKLMLQLLQMHRCQLPACQQWLRQPSKQQLPLPACQQEPHQPSKEQLPLPVN